MRNVGLKWKKMKKRKITKEKMLKRVADKFVLQQPFEN